MDEYLDPLGLSISRTLDREYGEPASSKLRRLREYICSIAPDLMHDDPEAFSNW